MLQCKFDFVFLSEEGPITSAKDMNDHEDRLQECPLCHGLFDKDVIETHASSCGKKINEVKTA